MKYLRGFGLTFFVLLTIMVLVLFFGGFLTGVEHLEFQNPYSRSRHIVETKYGIRFESDVPNEMSRYYKDVLKQSPEEIVPEKTRDSYVVERITGHVVPDKGPFAPITSLDPAIEQSFLIALPDNKTRLAVIRSLYRKRSKAQDAVALAKDENTRVKMIYRWYGYDQNDASVTPAQWWRDHAVVFGLTPEGESLPTAPQNLPDATRTSRR